MPTLYDVANLADVSISTVSRVINNYKHVRSEVRARVLQAIEELEYRPNKMAQSLRQQSSQLVGVLVRQQSTPFSSELVYSIEQELFKSHYQVILCSTNNDLKQESDYVDFLIDHHVSGVILRPTEASHNNVVRLLNNNIAVVTVDTSLPEINVTQIMSKNEEGGYLSIEHLVEYGHRRIAIIVPTRDKTAPSHIPRSMRLRGIARALDTFKEIVEPTYILTQGETSFEDGQLGMQKLINEYPDITAVFAITDMIAIGAMHTAIGMGKSIPEDISILGYDDIFPSRIVVPGLTTVAQPIGQMGRVAALALVDHIEHAGTPTSTIALENRLIIRGSTRNLRSESETV